MNQSKALLMSEKMAEALSTAGNDKITNGLFVCLDSEQGLYKFVPLADIKLSKESLGETIKTIRLEFSKLQSKETILEKTMTDFDEKYGETQSKRHERLCAILSYQQLCIDASMDGTACDLVALSEWFKKYIKGEVAILSDDTYFLNYYNLIKGE